MIDLLNNNMLNKTVYYLCKDYENPIIYFGIINGIETGIYNGEIRTYALIKCINYNKSNEYILETNIFDKLEDIQTHIEFNKLKKYKQYLKQQAYIYTRNYHPQRNLKLVIISSVYIGNSDNHKSNMNKIKFSCNLCDGYSTCNVYENELFLYDLFYIVLNNRHKFKIIK